jgi:DNA-binding HxlR family transcriptional regulator
MAPKPTPHEFAGAAPGEQAPCPASAAFAMIGGKWKLSILQLLIFDGIHRFGELRRKIDGITQTMLTAQLRALERDGLIARKIFAEVPPRVEYSATSDALGLIPMFTAMHVWWTARDQTQP